MSVTITDVLTKISNVFKNDIYVVDYLYCIGGDESEEKNETKIVLQFSPDVIELWKELSPDNGCFYIKSVKDAKTDFANNIVTNLASDKVTEIHNRVNEVNDFVEMTETWDSFSFSEEELATLFDNNGSIELFNQNDEIPSVTVAKNIFPLVTAKTVNKLYYKVYLPDEDNAEELVNMITQFTADYFQIYSRMEYIPMSAE